MASMRPFHIALVNLGTDNWLGGHHYFLNIIRALAALPAAERDFALTYVVGAPLDPALTAELSGACRILVAPELRAPNRALPARIGRALRRTAFGLHSPPLHDLLVREQVDFAYPCATGGEKTGRYRSAHWIADLQFKHFPQFQLPEILAGQRDYLEGIVSHAQTIVLSSQFGQADCHTHYPQSIGRTFVLPFRVTPALSAGADDMHAPALYHLPKRFFLLSNQFWQNKNHLMVFEAAALLKARGVDITIACTGHIHDSRRPAYSDRVLAAQHEFGVADRVRLLGAIPRAHQLDLLRRAVAVLQPSLFEGWNTSIEEARYFGKVVVASNFPVHLEQAWPDMTLFEATDPHALADALETAWHSAADGTIDPPREETARAGYDIEIARFARRFLDLARGKP